MSPSAHRSADCRSTASHAPAACWDGPFPMLRARDVRWAYPHTHGTAPLAPTLGQRLRHHRQVTCRPAAVYRRRRSPRPTEPASACHAAVRRYTAQGIQRRRSPRLVIFSGSELEFVGISANCWSWFNVSAPPHASTILPSAMRSSRMPSCSNLAARRRKEAKRTMPHAQVGAAQRP